MTTTQSVCTKFTVYWKDGSTNTCSGPTFNEAFTGGNWATIAGYAGENGESWWPFPQFKPEGMAAA